VDQYLDDLFMPVFEWDSFQINKDSKAEEGNDPPQDRQSSSPNRERSISPVRGSTREEDPNQLAGSIGKLKISSELRSKLELVTVAHAESSNRPTGEQQQTEFTQDLIHRFTDQAEKVKPVLFRSI